MPTGQSLKKLLAEIVAIGSQLLNTHSSAIIVIFMSFRIFLKCINFRDVNKEKFQNSRPRPRTWHSHKQEIATQEENRSFNERLLDSLHDTDSSSFWIGDCGGSDTATNVLNGKYGDSNILSEFINFYQKYCTTYTHQVLTQVKSRC